MKRIVWHVYFEDKEEKETLKRFVHDNGMTMNGFALKALRFYYKHLKKQLTRNTNN